MATINVDYSPLISPVNIPHLDDFDYTSNPIRHRNLSHVPSLPEPSSPILIIPDLENVDGDIDFAHVHEQSSDESVSSSQDTEADESRSRGAVKRGSLLSTFCTVREEISPPTHDSRHLVRIIMSEEGIVLVPARDITQFFVRPSNNSRMVGDLLPKVHKYKAKFEKQVVNCLTELGIRELARKPLVRRSKIYEEFIRWVDLECIPTMLRVGA